MKVAVRSRPYLNHWRSRIVPSGAYMNMVISSSFMSGKPETTTQSINVFLQLSLAKAILLWYGMLVHSRFSLMRSATVHGVRKAFRGYDAVSFAHGTDRQIAIVALISIRNTYAELWYAGLEVCREASLVWCGCPGSDLTWSRQLRVDTNRFIYWSGIQSPSAARALSSWGSLCLVWNEKELRRFFFLNDKISVSIELWDW